MEYFHVGARLKTEQGKKGRRKHQGDDAAKEKASERRNNNRKPLNLWLTGQNYVPLDGKKHPSPRLLDLSKGGAFISGIPAQLHSEIYVQFVLPNRLAPIKVRGRVVWSRITKDESSAQAHGGMGIQFTELSQEDQNTLNEFLESWTKNQGQSLEESGVKITACSQQPIEESGKNSLQMQNVQTAVIPPDPPWVNDSLPEIQPGLDRLGTQKPVKGSDFFVSEEEIDKILLNHFDK